MEDSLKNKTLKGVRWSFIDNIAGSGITFLVGLVLARLLSPAEFGIIGMITIFIAISNSIVDSGFSNALIRKLDASDKDYNTVFIFNLGISLLLYLLLYAGAPAISRFFNEPQLVPVTRVVGLVLVCNALGIIQRTLLVKAVNFKTQAKISIIASSGSGIIGIGMALYGLGVWSLVAQQVSRQLLNSLFLWIFNRWRPAIQFSINSFKELFGFGSKLMLSGIINTVYQNIYYLVIGKFYSPSQLGQYTRAEQFNNIFSQNLTTVVQRVSYPVLSSIQNEEERLLVAYRKVIKTTMMVTFACMLGMAAIAKPMILILIGEKWLPAVTYLQIMCFAGMLYPLHAINLNILQVKGRSNLFLKLEIYKKILAIIPITLGIFFGIEYLLLGSVFNSFIAFFLNSYYSSTLIDYFPSQQIKDILPAFVISIITAGIMWFFSFLPWNNWVILALQLSLGVSIAWILYEQSRLSEYLELKSIFLSYLQKLKK
ncbi:MAG: lipopolysaccharide biosynthesis protein [Proteiniphilum sp.]|uniref:lipopolysaccharide biosynthesis protein n=1 Tax=Proteiniphilum sp. TaxID=1926877 RepID=UPI002B1EF189|nr:lipopolysaccharide biosynthesis protein [Proteiniphilum sp.]MEA5127266.1 lipopolysaccharide biosynthesis protein [Proteiniphilum sp.]